MFQQRYNIFCETRKKINIFSNMLLLQSPIKAEPKKQNRWLLKFPTDVGIQTWALKSVKAPTMNLTENEMKFINTSTFVLGS